MKDFLMSVSAVSVILAGIWLIIPQGNMQKPLKYAIGIFSIAALISAVSKIDVSLPETGTEYTGTELSYSIEMTSLETAIETMLLKNNIPVKKVTAVTDISEGDSINITKVVLELENAVDEERAAEMVMKETGITAECE